MSHSPEEQLCFFQSKYVKLKDANINIRTQALQYGIACFGGIRGYYNQEQKNIYLFRLDAHYQRLKRSAHILQLQFPYTQEQFKEIILTLLIKSQWRQNIYIRPFLYKSSLELSPRLHELDDDFFVYVIPLNDYLDTQKGLKVCVSSYTRFSDNQIPTKAKTTAGYLNSALAKSEALQRGYDESILLDINYNVAEGSTENIFLVRDGTLITPDNNSSILEGITQKTIIELAKNLSIPLEVRKVDRMELYSANEVFFCGTGVQVAWIKSIDERIVDIGSQGPITQQLQDLYFQIVNGQKQEYKSWLTPVY